MAIYDSVMRRLPRLVLLLLLAVYAVAAVGCATGHGAVGRDQHNPFLLPMPGRGQAPL